MLSTNITICGDNLIKEFSSYHWGPSGSPTGPDHLIDAARYAFTYINNY